MRTIFEWLSWHTLVLPLLGAYYLLPTTKKRSVDIKIPLCLGGVVLLATGVQAGTLANWLQGLLYGIATFGAAMAGAVGQHVTHRHRERLLGVEGATPPTASSTVEGADPTNHSGSSRFSLYGLWRGLLLGAVFCGVQLAIGLLFAKVVQEMGGSMDSASVQELVAQSPWPWLLPIATGLAAGIYEELVYRKLADVWLRRWLPRWYIALVSSLLWASTHTLEGITPWYWRIVELGLIVGPLSFWFYRRFGLFPTIVAHAGYNATVVLLALFP